MDRRAINRATLERQLLLRRSDLPVVEAVERLAGLQAQTPHSWYVGLWTRLAGLTTDDVAEQLVNRKIVRIVLMRSTIHLVSGRDCLAMRPLVETVSERGMRSNFGRNLVGLDLDEIASAGRELIAERPLTFSALGKLLADRWPGRDPASLCQVVRAKVPLVQVPPRGVWGKSGPIAHTTAEAWLGRSDVPPMTPEAMIMRYLAAFGPATVKDAQTWSGLTRLREVADRLDLVDLGDGLLDLPDAPRPDPGHPAPVRFLYDFDNLLLSHADRSRVITDQWLDQSFWEHGPMPSALLVDGFTGGTWRIVRGKGTAILGIHLFKGVADKGVVEEGARLLDYAAPGDVHDIRFVEAEQGIPKID